MSQGSLCPNLTKKVQKEVSQMANRNFSPVILLGGLSVNLNHLKTSLHYMNVNSVSQKVVATSWHNPQPKYIPKFLTFKDCPLFEVYLLHKNIFIVFGKFLTFGKMNI